MLALFLQWLAPPGYMMARQGGQATIVICTGHEPAHALGDLSGHPAKRSNTKPDAPCVFAGHGVGVPTPIAVLIASPLARATLPPTSARRDLIPGRGLAAPPPPSHAPPAQLT